MLIRSSDRLVELEDKAKLAKRSKADVFLELHYNSAGAGQYDIRGVEVYCLTPVGANPPTAAADRYGDSLPGNRNDERNILLAYQIHGSLVESAGLADRGVRRARFLVLATRKCPRS